MTRPHNADTTDDTVQTWLQTGIERGWCSTIYCHTHDGPPLTDHEYQPYDDGDDICTFSVRIYTDTPEAH